jgi:hypothetical protein
MRRIPNLNSFQNGIDATVEAGDGPFEPLDQVLNPRCRNSIVLNFPSLPNLASNGTPDRASAHAPWEIPAPGLRSLKIMLLHDVLLRFGTFEDRISKFRPGARKKLANAARIDGIAAGDGLIPSRSHRPNFGIKFRIGFKAEWAQYGS